MRPQLAAREALGRHWPEYLMEAAELGAFMISACGFSVLLFHPASPATRLVTPEWTRRILMGVAMACTGAAIVYSPWGKQSGAHFNPAVTLTFWRLGRVATWDAMLYIVAQTAGGLAGASIAAAMISPWLAHDAVHFAATTPGAAGAAAAWRTEFVLAFVLMSTVLVATSTPAIGRFTGLISAGLVAIYIPLAAPISGMSLNPARSLASAVPSHIWTSIWVYFTAPPLAMLLAAECFVRRHGVQSVRCAKLHHDNARRCIFCQTQAASLAAPKLGRNPILAVASKTTTSTTHD